MIHTHQTAPTQFVEANGIRFAYRRLFGDRRLGHLKAKHQKLAMDPGRPKVGFPYTSRWIRSRRPRSILGRPALLRDFQRQNTLKPARTQDGLRLNHLHRTKKARPKPRHPYEQRAITAKQSETRWCPPQSDG